MNCRLHYVRDFFGLGCGWEQHRAVIVGKLAYISHNFKVYFGPWVVNIDWIGASKRITAKERFEDSD